MVGAGLSGLAYAWRRAREGRRVLVLEATSRVGGSIETERTAGYVLDHGDVAVEGEAWHLEALLAALPGAPRLAEPVAGTAPPLVWARGGLVRPRASLLGRLVRRPGSWAQEARALLRPGGRDRAPRAVRVFDAGTGALPEALAGALGGRIRLAQPVERIHPRSSPERVCTVEVAGGTCVLAREVALDLPSGEQARLLAPHAPHHADVLAAMLHEPIVFASVGLAPGNAGRLPRVAGFRRAPDHRGRIIDAVFVSHLAPGRAPGGRGLLSVRLGGAGSPGLLDLPDPVLERIVVVDLGRALRMRVEPDLLVLRRRPRAVGRPAPGHRGRMATLAAEIGGRGIRLLGRHVLGNSLENLAAVGAPVRAPIPEGVVIP